MSLTAAMLANARKLLSAGKPREAGAVLTEILRTRPAHPEALQLVSEIADRTLNFDPAIAAFEAAAGAEPGLASAQFGLSRAFFEAGRVDQAEPPIIRAIALAPGEPKHHMHLGRVLLGQGRIDEAFTHLSRGAELAPTVARIWYNYGGLLLVHNRAAQAATALRRADVLEPGNPLILAELGRAVLKSGSAADALDILARARTLGPKVAAAVAALGGALVEIGRGEEGCELLKRALDLEPESRDIRQQLVMALNYVSQDGALMRVEHRAFGERMERAVTPMPAASVSTDKDRRLRVGFLSADLRRHSCAHFLLPLFSNLDRREFEVIGITATRQADDVTARFQASADGWCSIAQLPVDAAGRVIRDAGIDILIECSGHTDGSRLDICAARPAPVQMTFLGYPNTTGLRAVDYRLVDAITDPPGAEVYCEEKLLRVDECLWCFRPSDDAPSPGPLPALDVGHVTFGCFNALTKFSQPAVEAWCRILAAVPGSMLLVKNNRVSDPHTLAAFRSRFETLGVDPSRVVAVPYTASTADHLRVYERIDLQLDTFPYNGTTTTCESLWQGVPVLAVRGRVHAAKVSESLLHAVGLDDWIAADVDAYVAKAAELGADLPRLGALRAALRTRMAASPLRDEAGYARRFAAALHSAIRARRSPGQ